MTFEPLEHRTSIATLTIIRPDLVEIRYDPGTIFSPKNVGEVQAMRRKVMGNGPYATLTFLPEDVDYQMETMRQDHAQADRGQGQLLASAIVAKASMIELLTKLYFSYFPQLHRVLVTDDEQAARSWLTARMEEIARTGS